MRYFTSGMLCFLILFGICACSAENSKNIGAIKTGVYILENVDSSGTIPNLVLEDDNKFTFTYSALSSNIPVGTYEVKGDKLILSADTQGEEKIIYVFEINDGALVYQQAQSTAFPSFTSDEIYDGAVFIYSSSN